MAVNPLTLWVACGALATAVASAAHAAAPLADGTQSLVAVQRAAVAALRREIGAGLAGVELTAVDLDERLRVPACPTALETSTNPPRGAQSRVLVRVGCRSPANWNINVPVDIRRETTV